MPLGSLFLVIDENATLLRKAVYNAPNSPYIYIDDNDLLKIRMGHSDKKFVLTNLPDYQYYTYKIDIRIKRAFHYVIGGIILAKDEPSAPHREAVQMFTEKLSELRENSEESLKEILQERYAHYFARPQLILDKMELETRLSEKVKDLNKQGKFDEATAMLEKVKKIPKKLYKAHETAEQAIKTREFEKAIKEFENAQSLAADLGEKDLVQMYKEKIKVTARIPSLLKRQKEFVETALMGMRNDDFSMAQKNFKKAAEVSEELMDSRSAEEYALKAKALAEYVKVDKAFN